VSYHIGLVRPSSRVLGLLRLNVIVLEFVYQLTLLWTQDLDTARFDYHTAVSNVAVCRWFRQSYTVLA